MRYKDPKFDIVFGSNISAALTLLKEQERFAKRFSIIESPVSQAIKQIHQDSAIMQASKTISSFAALVEPINKLKNISAAEEIWNSKFKNVFSPVWEKMELFSKFHDQTTQIGKIINPSISDFIESNVRKNYVSSNSITAVEATYLEAFEQMENEIDMGTLQEITEEIISNPTWREEFNILIVSFRSAYLRDEFTDAISDLINRRLKINNPKIVAGFISIILLIYFIWNSIEQDNQEQKIP